jgi:hypothetical protein
MKFINQYQLEEIDMAHNFISFAKNGKASEENARSLVSDAIGCVTQCYASVLKNDDFSNNLSQIWFGNVNANVQTGDGVSLLDGLKLIKTILSGSIRFEWNPAGIKVNAGCFTPSGGWQTGSLGSARNRLTGNSGAQVRPEGFRIVFYPPLFRMRVSGTNALPITMGAIRDQNQIGTLIHEITHAILNTEDYAYGVADAKLLATANAAQAMDNAENWGFYCSEFGNLQIDPA